MHIALLYCRDGQPGEVGTISPLLDETCCRDTMYFARRCKNPSVFTQFRVHVSIYRMSSERSCQHH